MNWLKRFYAILIIDIICVSATVARACPYQVPDCICEDLTVTCSSLREMPQVKTGNDVTAVEKAVFKGGSIISLTGNSFPPYLVSIEFEDQPLTSISDDDFKDSTQTLNELSFKNSGFTSLPNALQNLANLTSLSVIDTQINYWDNVTLQQIAMSLISLTLDNVGLTEWPNWFSLFLSLRSITLNLINLTIIPDNALDHLKDTLQTLDLTNCELTEIPKTLAKLTQLIYLDISYNSIQDYEGRPGVEQLTSFPFANTIIALFLEALELKTIPHLSNMPNLMSIFLGNNQISDPTTGSLPPGG